MNKIDQHAAMKQTEEVLKKLSRQGLKDYLSKSCGIEPIGVEWDECPKQDLIDTALQADYGTEAYVAYRAAGL